MVNLQQVRIDLKCSLSHIYTSCFTQDQQAESLASDPFDRLV